MPKPQMCIFCKMDPQKNTIQVHEECSVGCSDCNSQHGLDYYECGTLEHEGGLYKSVISEIKSSIKSRIKSIIGKKVSQVDIDWLNDL